MRSCPAFLRPVGYGPCPDALVRTAPGTVPRLGYPASAAQPTFRRTDLPPYGAPPRPAAGSRARCPRPTGSRCAGPGPRGNAVLTAVGSGANVVGPWRSGVRGGTSRAPGQAPPRTPGAAPHDDRPDRARAGRRAAAPARPADRARPDRAHGRGAPGRAAAHGGRAAGLGLHLDRGARGVARPGAPAGLGAHGERGRGPSDVPGAGRLADGGHQRARRLRPAGRRVRGGPGAGRGQGSAAHPGAAAGAGVAAPGEPAGGGYPCLCGRFGSHRPGDRPGAEGAGGDDGTGRAGAADRCVRAGRPGPADLPRGLGDRGGTADGGDVPHVRRAPVRRDAALRVLRQRRARAAGRRGGARAGPDPALDRGRRPGRVRRRAAARGQPAVGAAGTDRLPAHERGHRRLAR
ncbi:hypothetical protein SGPA1_30192 [Streptomyces misionensis JCM 4497]